MFGKRWLSGGLRIALALALLSLAALPAIAAAAGSVFPDVISLPDGFQPEGVASGRGTTFYAGSLNGSGIYRGDLRTGNGAILTAPQGGFFTGMKVDQRSNYLFVAGATTGKAWVFDAATGAQIAMLQLYPAGAGFINDVILTRDAAYFTNSFVPEIYRIPLGPAGSLDQPVTAETITLSGEWVQGTGFGANGIEATPDGRYLIIVNTNQGTLYRVDPMSGDATLIDLGGQSVTNGDGILLQGKTLYVVRNSNNLIAVFQMSPDYASAQFLYDITDSDFVVPTTIARFGDYLYAVNAKFGMPSPTTIPYEVVQVRR
jgi:sugar lactone lactonase YvrE